MENNWQLNNYFESINHKIMTQLSKSRPPNSSKYNTRRNCSSLTHNKSGNKKIMKYLEPPEAEKMEWSVTYTIKMLFKVHSMVRNSHIAVMNT